MEGSQDSDVPFSISPIEEDTINAIIGKEGTKFPWSMVRVGPSDWVLLERYQQFAAQLYNSPLAPTQAWVVGFPRSGTTMMQELVWLIHNDVNFEESKNPIQKRVKFIDACFLRDSPMPVETEEDKQRNVIKTHLAFDLLPPKLIDTCKIIFIARNPKDAAVSFFKFKPTADKFDDYWKQFEGDLVTFGPFWKYTLQGWAQRNHPNVLFIFYEDTQTDMQGTILKVAAHLGKQLTEEQVAALEAHMDISSFKKNKAVNHEFLKTSGDISCDFVRQGGIGGWREHFSEELNAKADAWIKENTEGTGFSFPDN